MGLNTQYLLLHIDNMQFLLSASCLCKGVSGLSHLTICMHINSIIKPKYNTDSRLPHLQPVDPGVMVECGHC